jgi:hypothetical protein
VALPAKEYRMKFRKLPPLHVLHTFEVAAGNLSFKLTAEQLALTPSAVSHQMLALEQFLGTPLFVRKNRQAVSHRCRSGVSEKCE